METPWRLVLVLLLLPALTVSCGEDDAPPPGGTSAAVAPVEAPPRPGPPTAVDVAPVETGSVPDQVEPAEASPEILSEKWYARHVDGQHAGWMHVVWTPSEYEGQETVHDRTEGYSVTTRRMGSVEDRFESRSLIELQRTPEGGLLWMQVHTTQGNTVTVSTQTWTGAGYTLVQRSGDTTDTREVACAEPVPADSEVFLGHRIRAGELEVGQRLEYPVPNFLAERMDTIELVVEGRELLTLPTGSADCWRVRESVRGREGSGVMWVDDDGVYRRHRAERSESIHTTRVRARDVRHGGASYSITVSASPELPRCTSFDRSVVEVTVAPRDGQEDPVFPDSPYSRVLEQEPGRVRVEMTAHDDPDATLPYPFEAPEELADDLESTLLLCADHPSVQRALADALGPEPPDDAREVARLLLRYVFDGLGKTSGPNPQPNAAQILEDGCGDCSEHNVLFVTLCRAAGIPARRWSGYAQVGGLWGSHAFCEIWLGKWIGADPTTQELGTRARYIAFGANDDPDSEVGTVSARSTGRLSIRTVSFEDEGEQVVIGESDAVTETTDPRSGIRVASAPEGWTSRVGRGFANLRSGETQCLVEVHAGIGDLDAEQLQRSVMGASRPVFEFAGREVAGWRRTFRERVRHRIAIPHRRRALLLTISTTPEREAEAMDVILKWIAPALAPADTETGATESPPDAPDEEHTPPDQR